MRNPGTHPRAPIVFLLLLALAPAAGAAQEWRAPFDPAYELDVDLPIEPIRPGVDPCSCLRELRSCLIAATLNLGRCLSEAHTPARQVLCYLKFELDVLICLDRARICQQTCVP